MAKLRTVQLAEVARYLECNPEKLRTALQRLAENPSAIEYGIGKAASIIPARRAHTESAEEKDAVSKADVREALMCATVKVVEEKILEKEVREILLEGPATLEEIHRRINDRRLNAVLAAMKYMEAKKATLDTRPIDPQAAKWLN